MTNPAEIRERLKEILKINNFSAIEAEMYYICTDLLGEVAIIPDLHNHIGVLSNELNRLQKQVDVMKAGLENYAKPGNWRSEMSSAHNTVEVWLGGGHFGNDIALYTLAALNAAVEE